jgi:hypothetical protein
MNRNSQGAVAAGADLGVAGRVEKLEAVRCTDQDVRN